MKIRLVNLKVNEDNYRFFTTEEDMMSDIELSLHNVFKSIYGKCKIKISYIDFVYHDMTQQDEENFYNFPMEQIAKTVNSNKVKTVKIYAVLFGKNKNYYFTNKGKITA